MLIIWPSPASEGGAPITNYIVERKWVKCPKWRRLQPTRDSWFKTDDLTKGKEYQFRVAAVNKAGQGPFSEASEPKYFFGMYF